MIRCVTCLLEKDESEFSPDKHKVNWKKSSCKECKNKKTREYRRHKRKTDKEWVRKTNKDMREYFKNNPHKSKQYYKTKTKEQHLKYMLKSKYWITIECYNDMLKAQWWVCKICKCVDVKMNAEWETVVQRLAVDHCHETWTVRWLLCQKCNWWLWLFLDDASLLSNAIDYLNEFNNVNKNDV